MAPRASKPKKEAKIVRPLLHQKLPQGSILTTILLDQFKVGKHIGGGAFGDIYLCSPNLTKAVGEDAPAVVKIEPHGNGPLYVERNFYCRAATPSLVSDYKEKHGLSYLGVPTMRGWGSCYIEKERFRFLVLDRFGSDLDTIFLGGKHIFSLQTTCNLALKLIDALEYIHSTGFVHNDIKAQNILLGHGKLRENEIFLVDFGLATSYQKHGLHLENGPDARRAHDGTMEYTSRDGHTGAHWRRSDLESLGYNMVHWLTGTLPWLDNVSNGELVEIQKKSFMGDIPAFLFRCFGDDQYPGVLVNFFDYVNSLEFHNQPDYEKLRTMFKQTLKESRWPLDGKLDFSEVIKTKSKKKTKQKKKAKPKPKVSHGSDEVDGRKALVNPDPAMSPPPDLNDCGALTRSSERSEDLDNWSWERVLCSNPEELIRQASRQSEDDGDMTPLAQQRRAFHEKMHRESLANPTPEMLRVQEILAEKERERVNMTWQQQLQCLNDRKHAFRTCVDAPKDVTPHMEEVMRRQAAKHDNPMDIPITPEPSDFEDNRSDASSHEEYMPPSMSKKKLSSNGRFRHEKIKRSQSYDDNASNSSEDFYDLCTRAPTYRPSKNRARGRRRSAAHDIPDEDDFISRDGLSMKFTKLSTIYDFQDENLDEISPSISYKFNNFGTKEEKHVLVSNRSLNFKDVLPRPSKRRRVTVQTENIPEETSKSKSPLPKRYSKKKQPLKTQPAFPTEPVKLVPRNNPGRLTSSPQRISVIPVDICIETLGENAEHKGGKSEKKAKKSKKKLKKKKNVTEAPLVRPVEPTPTPPPTESSELLPKTSRVGRSRGPVADFSWEKILISHPDRLAKKRKSKC